VKYPEISREKRGFFSAIFWITNLEFYKIGGGGGIVDLILISILHPNASFHDIKVIIIGVVNIVCVLFVISRQDL
jgi:hypothetical protein